MAFAVMVEGTASARHVETVRNALVTLAHESMKQPGTLRYEFYQPENDPLKFILFALWEDEAGWRANVASAEHDRYMAALPEDAWTSRPALTKLLRVDKTT